MACNHFGSLKQHILISGYIKTNFSKDIPNEIVIICSLFFNDDPLDIYVETLKKCDILSKANVADLCIKTKEILMEESNLVNINLSDNDKLIVVGDVRAQFYDLTVGIFDTFGYPNDDNDSAQYLFLGNYTSKGHYHTETLLLLLSLKARYPSKITLLRGQHECRQLSQIYGFYDDAMRKYITADVWSSCCDVFDYLPLCCLINQKIFALHSGLSPYLEKLDDIALINRFIETPHDGIMCDMLWSMPSDDVDSWAISPKEAGFFYGKQIVDQFCETNNIDLIIRSCDLVSFDEAHRYLFDNKLLHIFSAPNFAYRCGNKGTVAVIDKDSNVECKIFVAAPAEKRPLKDNGIPQYFV